MGRVPALTLPAIAISTQDPRRSPIGVGSPTGARTPGTVVSLRGTPLPTLVPRLPAWLGARPTLLGDLIPTIRAATVHPTRPLVGAATPPTKGQVDARPGRHLSGPLPLARRGVTPLGLRDIAAVPLALRRQIRGQSLRLVETTIGVALPGQGRLPTPDQPRPPALAKDTPRTRRSLVPEDATRTAKLRPTELVQDGKPTPSGSTDAPPIGLLAPRKLTRLPDY